MSRVFSVPDKLAVPPRVKSPAPGEMIDRHLPTCFGCGEMSQSGVHVHAIAQDGLEVTAEWAVEQRFEGGPGVIHGGVLSAVFDELMGKLLPLIDVVAVTAHLEVDYVAPILVGSQLRLHARIIGVDDRKIYTEASARLGDDPPVATAHGLFIVINPLKHFAGSWQSSRVAEQIAAQATGKIQNP